VRRSLAVALLFGVVVAAGCDSGSSKKQAQPLPPAVPWSAATPPQVDDVEAVSRPCRASDLEPPGQVQFEARLEGGFAVIPLRNVSKTACRLTGRPRVVFAKQGGPEQEQKRIPTTPTNFPVTTYPESSLLALKPGQAGDVSVTWVNWCDLIVQGKPHVPPSALRVTLPGGRGSLDMDYNAVPPCLDPKAPSTIGVSDFQPSVIPTERSWTKAVLQASVPNQPVHARRGGLLRYRVVLRNLSRSTVRLDHCPPYAQQLVPSGHVETYMLNCRGVEPLRPGTSVAFAMRLRVPKSSPLGANGLFWDFDAFGAQAPQAHAAVVIAR
jgi:Domain of unknown function (DUF4232)